MDRRHSRPATILLRAACSLLFLLTLATVAGAAPPQVAFDMSYTAECRDVTPEGFWISNPDLRIVEARFRISTRFEEGREAHLDELLIEITSPDQPLPIVDFMPRTELDTDIAGEIEVVKNSEDSRTTNAGVGGTVGVEYGIIKAQLAPNAGGGKTHIAGTKETYKRVPPRHLLLASGTINHGQGVFFKLKPSPRGSLEGLREYACLFAVPMDWTGQWVRVTCQARATKKSYFSTKQHDCGAGVFFVGLYLQGDGDARLAAEMLARAQAIDLREDKRGGSGLSLTAFKPLLNHAACAKPGKRNKVEAADDLESQPDTVADALESLSQLSGSR